MPTLSRSTIVLTLLALTGWGAFWFSSNKPHPASKVEEKIVYVDRVATSEKATHKTKTTTLPNGTKVVETVNSKVNTTKREQTSKTEKTSTTASAPSYSLGLSIGRTLNSSFLTQPNIYQLELGHRILKGPLWTTISLSNDRTVSMGLRLEF